MDTEKWLPAFGFESSHEVSNMGNIRSYKRMQNVKYYPDARGYSRFKINDITIKVHRLVAQTFIPNPEGKKFVNHKNGIKTDNRSENLEWVTNKENMEHAVKNGYYKNNHSVVWEEKKRKVACYNDDGIYKEFDSLQEASRQMGLFASNIHHALSGKIKKSKNLYWKYI